METNQQLKEQAKRCLKCGASNIKNAFLCKECKDNITHIDAMRILKIIGWVLLAILALAMWYVALPILLGWLMWTKTKWNKKTKNLATIGLVILCVILISNTGSKYNTENKKEAESQPVTSAQNQQVSDVQAQEKADADIKAVLDAVNQQKSIDNNQETQEILKQDETKIDFTIYDEFFKTKNEQLKRIDDIVKNTTTSRHQEIIKMGNPGDSKEYAALVNIQDKLYAVEEKMNKDNSLHKIAIEAMDYYSDSADSCKDWLILLPPTLEFSDWNNYKLADNSIIEKMPRSCGNEERKKGDEKSTELLNALNQKGYKNNSSPKSINVEKPVQTKQLPAYKEILSFSGAGTKNSESFTIIGSKFKVTYKCIKESITPLCQAVLRSPTNDSLYKEIFNNVGEAQGDTVFYEKGTFYIEATVMGGSFDILVEEYK